MTSEIEPTVEEEIVRPSKEWNAIQDECVAKGLTTDCNLVAAIYGADLDVVLKKLSCGCILVPDNDQDVIL